MAQLVEEFRKNLNPVHQGSFKGHHHTEKTKEKLRLAQLGTHHTEETKYKIGLVSKGRKQTEEDRHKKSLALKGKPKSKKHVDNMILALTGRELSNEHKIAIGRGMEELWQTSEYCNKQEEYRKSPEGHQNTLRGAKLGAAANKRHEVRQKKRGKMLAHWQDENWVKKELERLNRKPTTLELKFTSFLEEHFPNEWKYVGDFNFWITLTEPLPDGSRHLNPDWKRTNSKVNGRKLIELNGPYYHDNENPQDRIDAYAKVGWDCLVIWEYELKDEQTLIKRITELERKEAVGKELVSV